MSNSNSNTTVNDVVDVEPTTPVNRHNSRQKVGIKHRNFTADNDNGTSHRKNKDKKKAQYLRNVATRAALYSQFQGNAGRNPGEFHAALKALSMGTA
jgi:hypothetical protein